MVAGHRRAPGGSHMRDDVPMLANVRRIAEHRAGRVIFGSRKWVRTELADLTGSLHGARILEIGSGRQDMGEDAYSFRDLFAADNEFVQSDVNPEHGHLVVDVTKMDFVEEWDVILCVSVLEHVPDFAGALRCIYRALKPGGRAVIVAPMCFPYHDEPHDYWWRPAARAACRSRRWRSPTDRRPTASATSRRWPLGSVRPGGPGYACGTWPAASGSSGSGASTVSDAPGSVGDGVPGGIGAGASPPRRSSNGHGPWDSSSR